MHQQCAPEVSGVRPLTNTITGIAGCCACAASGHAAAAPPSVAKNFRRSMWLAMRPSGWGVIHAMDTTFPSPGL
jgi:hypothetical protein